MVKFSATKKELAIIKEIAHRAERLAFTYEIDYPFRDIMMDLDATHSNGNPLRLNDLLNADDGNFGHDIFGIRRHINRETGQLENCFSPRFSMSVVRAVAPEHRAAANMGFPVPRR